MCVASFSPTYAFVEAIRVLECDLQPGTEDTHCSWMDASRAYTSLLVDGVTEWKCYMR